MFRLCSELFENDIQSPAWCRKELAAGRSEILPIGKCPVVLTEHDDCEHLQHQLSKTLTSASMPIEVYTATMGHPCFFLRFSGAGWLPPVGIETRRIWIGV